MARRLLPIGGKLIAGFAKILHVRTAENAHDLLLIKDWLLANRHVGGANP